MGYSAISHAKQGYGAVTRAKHSRIFNAYLVTVTPGKHPNRQCLPSHSTLPMVSRYIVNDYQVTVQARPD